MGKEVRDGTIASIALIVGVVAIFIFRQVIEGLVLIVISGFIAWFSPGLKEVLLSFFKLVISKFSSNNEQNMININSPYGIQQQSQNITNYFGHESREIDLLTRNKKERISINEEKALKETYKKMVKALREVNRIGNVGVKNKEEYKKVNMILEEFISAKMENEIDINEDIKSKFDEVMGAFRYTMHEIYILVSKGKFNQGVHGLKSFNFIQKSKEVTTMIKQKLGEG